MKFGCFYWATIAAIGLAMLGQTKTSDAQETYEGRDANAAWRVDAAARIEQHRKSDLNVTVKRDGSLISNANVTVEMQRHDFKFGTAIDPRYFLQDQSRYDSRYEDIVKNRFTSTVFENHMKWRGWNGDFGSGFTQEITLAGLDWLNNNDIAVRGHAFIWPRHQSSPDFVRAILDDPTPTNAQLQELYDATFNHINDIGSATAGKIYAWDTVNEPRTSFDIEEKLIGFTPAGQTSPISNRTDLRKQWFAAGKAVDPNARMVLNDFGILPGGEATNSRRTENLEILRDLVAADTTLEGIGFQSHFKDLEFRPNGARIATGISHVLSLLDSYHSEFGLPVEITEFDFQSNDDSLKTDYTRDFLTAAFSHESVDSFHLWGFWEGKMANPEGALFDMDFNLTANGEEFFRLIEEEWWTDGMGMTDEMGLYGLRGFKGDYLVTVEVDGQVQQLEGFLGNGGLDLDFSFTSVPEPGSLLILGMFGAVGALRRRRS